MNKKALLLTGLAVTKLVARLATYAVLTVLAFNSSVVLGSVLALSFIATEVIGFVLSKELEKMQIQAANELLGKLQEEMVLNNTSQENWN